MRPGLDNVVNGSDVTIRDALGQVVIQTAMVFRLDFKSETICVWTGPETITPSVTGEALLAGQTLHAIEFGTIVGLSDNVMSYTGSDEFTISLSVAASPNTTLAAAEVYPSEYRGRRATIWRAMLLRPADPLAAPIWAFKRIRSGAMDKLEMMNDGNQHSYNLTIESHASLISPATQATYMDQSRIDPTDTSQAFAASLAAGRPAPSYGGQSGFGGSVYNKLSPDAQNELWNDN